MKEPIVPCGPVFPVAGVHVLAEVDLPGDIAIVLQQPIAQSGDVVVALVGDEATIKRIRIKKDRIELHPENKKFKPIIPDPDELIILGKVVEIRRNIEPI